jgi:hypothetical protein
MLRDFPDLVSLAQLTNAFHRPLCQNQPLPSQSINLPCFLAKFSIRMARDHTAA